LKPKRGNKRVRNLEKGMYGSFRLGSFIISRLGFGTESGECGGRRSEEAIKPPPLPQEASLVPRRRRSRRQKPPGTASTRKPNLASWTRPQTALLVYGQVRTV
jgi:hypothetical protein